LVKEGGGWLGGTLLGEAWMLGRAIEGRELSRGVVEKNPMIETLVGTTVVGGDRWHWGRGWIPGKEEQREVDTNGGPAL